MSKIALALIIKDDSEADDLTRLLKSVKGHVQGIFITGTKEPQEKIKKIAEEYGATYSFFTWNKSFADARNFAFSQVPPAEYQWIMWMDADDVLHGGANLPRVVEEAEKVNAGAIFAKYYYHVNLGEKPCPECGLHGDIQSVMIEHLRERLVRNDGSFKWESPIHETLIAQRPVNQTDNYDFAVVHLTTFDRMNDAIFRNIDILQTQLLDQDGKDPRTVYYLAKAYFDINDDELHDYTIDLLKQYLATSGWDQERGQAWQYLGQMFIRKQDYNQAILALLSGVAEWPQYPSLYIDLAVCYLFKNDWGKAEHWVELGAKLEIPKTTLVMNPHEIMLKVLEIRFNLYWNTGRLDEAYATAAKLINFSPDDLNKSRVDMVQVARRDNLLAHCISKLAVHFENTQDQTKLLSLMGAIPKEIENIPTMVDLRNKMLPPKLWDKNEVAIFCGPGFEQWSPKSLGKGLGGSESAVVYLSKELAKIGYKVTVFADPGDDEGEYDGVTYKPYYFFNPKDCFNVFVSWRQPQLFEIPLIAQTKLVWLHDIANPADYTKERLDRITKINCLSQWHRSNLANVPDDKFMIVGNGIPLPEVKETRVKNRLVYSSSYDRGLEHLLDMWPQVIKEVPDATLHIMYGWDLFDKVVGNDPSRLAWKAKMVEKMNQPGITHLGRVSHDQVVKEFAQADIWAYPTHFGETSCQVAMIAQSYGAVPCVIDYAALKETVQYGIKIDGDIYDEETQKVYTDALVDLLKNPEKQEEIRKNMIPWAKQKFGWDNIAKEWDKVIKQDIKVPEKQLEAVPA